MRKIIRITSKQVEEFERQSCGEEIEIEGFEGWRMEEIDVHNGDMDVEKGAMTDYPLVIVSPEGHKYLARGGYYTHNGHQFDEDLDFELEKPRLKTEEVVKVDVWYSIQDGGDGSASLDYFLTEEKAEKDQDERAEWGEPCTGRIETYAGSNIYKRALENN